MMDSPDYEIAGIVENDAGAKARLRKDPRLASVRWMSEEQLLKDLPSSWSLWNATPGRRCRGAEK